MDSVRHPARLRDEYLRIGEGTKIESVRRFFKVMIRIFGEKYVRAPKEENTIRLMAMNEKRRLSGDAR